MAARVSSTLALGLLVLGAVLLANPLYVTSGPEKGSLLLSAEHTDPVSGVASTTPRVRQVSDLSPVARNATRRAIENGSFVRSKDDPPLPIQQFATEWTILGSVSKEQFYRPTVIGAENRSTLRLEPV